MIIFLCAEAIKKKEKRSKKTMSVKRPKIYPKKKEEKKLLKGSIKHIYLFTYAM